VIQPSGPRASRARGTFAADRGPMVEVRRGALAVALMVLAMVILVLLHVPLLVISCAVAAIAFGLSVWWSR
jgi:hypothetical protein